MPDEIVGIVVIAITAGALVLTTFFVQLFKFLRTKHGQGETKSGGSSLTTSELEALVYRAVAEASVPLAARLAAIEERLEDAVPPRLELPEPGERLALDDEATPDPIPRRPSQHA